MNRRDFLRGLLTVAAGSVSGQLDIDRLLWVPGEKKIFIPSPKQIEFFTAADKISLYGIPYHACDGATGQWLGISRAVGISKDLVEMIQKLEADKRESS